MELISGGIAGLAIGIGSTIIAIRRGLVSKDTCKVCKQSLDKRADGIDVKMEQIDESIKGMHKRQDRTNEQLAELVGYMKGKENQGGL